MTGKIGLKNIELEGQDLENRKINNRKNSYYIQ